MNVVQKKNLSLSGSNLSKRMNQNLPNWSIKTCFLFCKILPLHSIKEIWTKNIFFWKIIQTFCLNFPEEIIILSSLVQSILIFGLLLWSTITITLFFSEFSFYINLIEFLNIPFYEKWIERNIISIFTTCSQRLKQSKNMITTNFKPHIKTGKKQEMFLGKNFLTIFFV